MIKLLNYLISNNNKGFYTCIPVCAVNAFLLREASIIYVWQTSQRDMAIIRVCSKPLYYVLVLMRAINTVQGSIFPLS